MHVHVIYSVTMRVGTPGDHFHSIFIVNNCIDPHIIGALTNYCYYYGTYFAILSVAIMTITTIDDK